MSRHSGRFYLGGGGAGAEGAGGAGSSQLSSAKAGSLPQGGDQPGWVRAHPTAATRLGHSPFIWKRQTPLWPLRLPSPVEEPASLAGRKHQRDPAQAGGATTFPGAAAGDWQGVTHWKGKGVPERLRATSLLLRHLNTREPAEPCCCHQPKGPWSRTAPSLFQRAPVPPPTRFCWASSSSSEGPWVGSSLQPPAAVGNLPGAACALTQPFPAAKGCVQRAPAWLPELPGMCRANPAELRAALGRGGGSGSSPQRLVVESLEAPVAPGQGGSLGQYLPTEVVPQPAVDHAVQEPLEGDAQGLRGERAVGATKPTTLPAAERISPGGCWGTQEQGRGSSLGAVNYRTSAEG